METSEELLSKATGIQAYDPTFRERSTRTVANLLRDKFGMDNYKAVELAQDIFGNPNAARLLFLQLKQFSVAKKEREHINVRMI